MKRKLLLTIAAVAGLSPLTASCADAVPYTLESQPKSPAESLAVLHLGDGFEAELVATEPLTASPVAIDWGADGKLWIVEMADYPMGLDGKMKPGGRVRFLEDTNGDGKYDKSTVFLDDVNFPNGILTWRNGVLVTAAPDIIFAADTDGDGKADVRQVLFTGFKEGNLQLRVNGLRWGFDTWVYCANGWSGGQPRSIKTGAQIDLSGHDLRIKPDDGSIDLQSGQTEFGRSRDDWGNWFGCDNSYPLFHFAFNDDYLRRNPYVAAPDAKRQLYLPANPKVYPRSKGQKRYHSFDQAGHFTSACSTDFYRDELLFPRGPVEHAFVCEPVHNLVQHLVVTEDGVHFTARRAEAKGESEFLASEDQWFRPVMARTGPDGALWIVDMYRYMIEHPDWLPPEGKRELAPFYRAGADRGRIYRIYPKGKRPPPPPRLDRMTTAQLVAVLESPNGWLRDKAQQLLIWRADTSAVEPLGRLAATSANPLARVPALFTLETLGALRASVIAPALRDPHPVVRRHALRLAEARAAASPELIGAAIRLVNDPDAKVRLQLACTLGEWDDPRAGEALGKLALANAGDADFQTAVMSSAVKHCALLVQSVAADRGPAADALVAPLLNLSLALHRRELVAQLLAQSFAPRNGRYDAAQLQALGQFLDTLARKNTSTSDLMRAADDALTQQLRRAPEVFAAARRLAPDTAQPPAARAAAASLLNRETANRDRDITTLAALLTPQTPEEIQRAAVKALGRGDDTRVPGLLLADWPADSPELRTTIVDEMAAREPWALDLLGRIERGQIGATDIDAQHRDRLLKHRSDMVRTLAAKVFAAAVNPDRQKVVDAFRPALTLAGDAPRGQAIFARLCAPCHRLDNVGHEIGPNLVSVKNHPPEKLLTSILDPSREVEPRYLAYNCTLSNGEELYGLIVSESGNSITLKLADDTTRAVLRSEIASLRSTKNSLMPEGLETGLVSQDLADLIQYLRVAGGD